MGTVMIDKKKDGSKRFRAEVRKKGTRKTKRFKTKYDAYKWCKEMEYNIEKMEAITMRRQALDKLRALG